MNNMYEQALNIGCDIELEEVLEYIDFLHKSNVDALIMQDIGLIKKTHELYPNLEIHISTQANTVSYHTCKFWHNNGAKRVILARALINKPKLLGF